ncbi:hypothetical protein ACHAXR_009451 [Thalassiosira sp. AJA248-18]
MQRCRRNVNNSGDDDNASSLSGNSLATTNSSASSSTAARRRSQRQQQPGGGSFASATASSLARGGPKTKAPLGRPASVTARTALPSRSSSSGEKENAENQTNGDQGKKMTPSKPLSANNNDDDEDASPSPSAAAAAAILSPTPYWKVLEERGNNRTSPRTTRSAAKKAEQQQNAMRELDELDDDDSAANNSSDNEEEDENKPFDPCSLFIDPSTVLHFSPPDRQLRQHRAENARRRRDAEEEKERVRLQKVRKVREAGMNLDGCGGSVARRRLAKKPRTKGRGGHPSANNNFKTASDEDESAANHLALLPPTGPSTEEMRQIMQQSLAEHNSARIEELVAKSAAATRDADHYKQRYQELQSKYDSLEEQVKSREGSESELQSRCVEQKGMIDGFNKKVSELELEKERLEDRHMMDREAFDQEKKRWEDELSKMKEEHAKEMQQMTNDFTSKKDLCEQTEEKYGAIQAELDSTQAKLNELIKLNEELDAWDRENGNREELLDRISKLKRNEADLMARLTAVDDANETHEDAIASLRADVESYKATISNNEGTILALESSLKTFKNDLAAAKRKMEGMQSPGSKDALEHGYIEEIDQLESKLASMESEKTELQNLLREKTGENQALKSELDGAKDDLRSQLNEINGHVEGAETAVSNLKSENAQLTEENTQLTEQVMSANAKYQENERQLEEIAAENEELLTKLESTENELQQMGSKAAHEVEKLEAKWSTVTAEKEALNQELNKARDDISEIQVRVGNLEGELTNSQQVTSSLQTEKKASNKKLTELSSQLQALTNHLESAQATIAALEAKLHAKDEYCQKFGSIERQLIQEKHVLNEIRRDLHNRVIQLSGNIRVFVRVRPMVASERQLTLQAQQQATNNNRRLSSLSRPSSSSGRPSSRGSLGPSATGSRPSSRGSMTTSSTHRSLTSSQAEEVAVDDQCPFRFPSITDRNAAAASSSSSSKSSPNYTSFNDLTKQTIELTEPHKDRGGLTPRRKKWKYGFDRVFNQSNGQEDVWEGAEPLVQSCVDGFHVCMFAYGQTGSGKTHTMIGEAQNRGLIPRAVEKLFSQKRDIEQGREGVSVDIRVELLEIYNEEVRDLLDDNAGPDGQLIKLKLSSNEAVGNVKVNARDGKEVAGILQLAQERRCVKATKSNAESSRSHLLFTIHFDVSSVSSDGVSRSGCLHIVDLAGSERVDKSGSHGALLTEAKHINTSLSALSHVIEKLQAKKSSSEHIPFRDSKLTYLLRNSLGGDSKTLAIVCCSPHQAHFNESLNSIRFAAKASKVELKEANKVDV